MAEVSDDLDFAESVDFDVDAEEVLERINSTLALWFDDLAAGQLPSLELARSHLLYFWICLLIIWSSSLILAGEAVSNQESHGLGLMNMLAGAANAEQQHIRSRQ